MAASPDVPTRVDVILGPHGFSSTVRAREHELAADEPLAVGGKDTGPTPYEYVLAGLGACTVMTLRMYAARKGWPLTGARVRLEHDRIHARDCEDCEDRETRIDRIHRWIELDGELDVEQRQRLMEIADRCPVHRTLTSETRILSELVPP